MEWRPISADSHITEPPNCYLDHIEPAWRERAPRIVHKEGLGDIYVVDGMKTPVPMGLVAAAGVAPQDIRTGGAIVLLSGLAGTGTGLALGGGLTGGEAAATVMGHDLAWATAAAITFAGDPNPFDDAGVDRMSSAVAVTAAGVGGYFAGRVYAGMVPHNLTVGDLQTLWTGATIGAAAAGTAIANSSPTPETAALSLLAGGWLGVVATERTLVRWYDHTRGEANLVALGGAAGALMGVGVGVLVNGEGDRGESVTLGFATAGAIAGVAMTERYLQPDRDAGRLAWLERVRITPGALAAAAMRTPGRHALVSVTF